MNNLLLFVLLTASLAHANDQQIVNATVEQRSATGGLGQHIRSVASENASAWVAYATPVIAGEQTMCCFDSRDQRYANGNCCGGCKLESKGAYISGKSTNCSSLEPSKVFFVFVRVAQGKTEKVRMFSENCLIDAGGMKIVWLGEVKPAESVAYLLSLAEADNGIGRNDELGDGAVAAIAMHDDASADAALAKLIRTGRNNHLVEQATFWVGNARGARGYDILAAELDRNGSFSFRKQAIFALSQNSDPRARRKLIELARHDSSSEIRGESLFWLAQEAGNKVAGVITDAIENDLDTDVKKKAVFALSEMPEEEGIPLLIDQAKKNRNPLVRKEAIFWLGQSKDPRALDYITSVLEK
jgi:hypothetical protein